ncbi:MAG: alpha/beta hydrolase [Ferruginibacter sp.]|nr:alpha/beta hydrolase [Ferruginibacter sp.]
MNRLSCILLLLVLNFTFLAVGTPPPERTVYAIKGNDTLWFDYYQPVVKSNGISVIFVHGGAFTGGDPENQKPMADGLNKLGYQVFVIKYRLYLKGKSFGCETVTPEKLKAIQYAAEDAMDATKYLVKNAVLYKIDTAKVFIAGSSAGAEAILNLVYNPFKNKYDSTYDFFKTFRYAGALSFSGALLDINTYLSATPVPLFLMHGTNDQLVPYGTSAHRFCNAKDAGWMMMFGPVTLYKEAMQRHWPLILYSYKGKGHEVSNFMFRNFVEMNDFMQNVVAHKKIKTQNLVIN